MAVAPRVRSSSGTGAAAAVPLIVQSFSGVIAGINFKHDSAKILKSSNKVLDAAVQVLGKSKEPMNCKTLVEAMAKQGLWTSPGGKTPHATLYAAILREINAKGNDARFRKVDRGQFTAAGSEA